MQVVRGRTQVATTLGRRLRAPAVAIGNFDGVHRGHQALIQAARTAAQPQRGETVVLTFDPHPARLFAPKLAPPALTTLDRRLELLADAGADVVVVERFDATFASLEAEAFVRDVLVGDLGARDVVVGYDFSFGRGRQGNTGTLTSMGAALGLGVHIIPPVTADGLVCSSTKIREFVLEGRVEGARLLLGRPYEISGPVVRGAGRGRGLGIPTANVDAENELLPRPGIYAARARTLDGTAVVRPAALSVGTNPTFAGEGPGRLTIEAYLLDFDGDLYGARLRLELEAFLREERRFASVDQLVAQIHADIARTREIVT
jgi:riboflavin kinase / FMN adenylyltransferase